MKHSCKSDELLNLIHSQSSVCKYWRHYHHTHYLRFAIRHVIRFFIFCLLMALGYGITGSLKNLTGGGWLLTLIASLVGGLFTFFVLKYLLLGHKNDILEKSGSYHLACAANLKQKRLNRAIRALRNTLDAHNPYAVYLRGFSLEMYRYGRAPGTVFCGAGEHESLPREPDETVIKVIQRFVPVFGIGNVHDATPPGSLILLYAMEEGWLDIVEPLVRNASLVVVHVSEVSRGLDQELEIIMREGRNELTLVLARNDEVAQEIRDRGFKHVVVIDPASLDSVRRLDQEAEVRSLLLSLSRIEQ
jgi:hypothetical protein